MEITFARGRSSGPIAVLILAAIFCLGAAYLGGAITLLGYEKNHITFSGYASGSRTGGGFGLKYLPLLEGQTFYARYDATVREGALRIGAINLFAAEPDDVHFAQSITSSGSGEVTYPIPETGLYSIFFEGSVLAPTHTGRYDISYDVTWGAR